MDIRTIEKTNKLGFMFYIKYDGKKFDAFDEIQNKFTVKGYFKDIITQFGFSWAKGIQQAGRTDAKVSANENILYVSSNFNGDVESICKKFNEQAQHLQITKVEKTFPNLVFPDFIEKREYIYKYPEKKIKRTQEEILTLCKELSGRYDVSEFTDKKGLELKEHIREVEIDFKNSKLFFSGNSFMPKQVRIMSGYILIGIKTPLEGKYLTLNKVILSDALKSLILYENKEIKVENVEKVYETRDKKLYIFYAKKEKKGEVIGKNGKNIKSLKKIYGNIVVREL